MGVSQSAPQGTLWGQLWKQYSKNHVLGVEEFQAVIRFVCGHKSVSMDHTHALVPQLSNAFQQFAHGSTMKQGVFLECAPLLYQRGEELVNALRAPKGVRSSTESEYDWKNTATRTVAGVKAVGSTADALGDARSLGSRAMAAFHDTRSHSSSAVGALMHAHFQGSNAGRTRFATTRHRARTTDQGSAMSHMAGADQIDPEISWVRQLMDMDAAKGVRTAKISIPGPRRDSIQDGLVVCPEPETLSDAESVRSVESISGYIKTKWDPTVHHQRYLYPADRAVEFSEKWKVDVVDFPPLVDAASGADGNPRTPDAKQYAEDTKEDQQNALRRRRLLRIREENLRKALDASSVFSTIRRPKTYEDAIILAKTFYDDVRREVNLFEGGREDSKR